MNKLNLLVALLLIALIPLASAAEVTVVKKELIDSQYGIITDVLGIGTKIYQITYSDGSTEQVAETGYLLSLGAITEMPSGSNIASTVCYDAVIQYRIKTISDSAGSSFSDIHKIQVWENDLMGSIELLQANFPEYKIYDSNSFQSSSSISTPYTVTIPYAGYGANSRLPFMVVEYQQKTDGTWVRLSNPGTGTTTTVMTEITWWDTYQSGGGRGALTAGTCRYPVPQPSVITTPTVPPVTTKTIQVASTPSGATVTSSGQTLGTTPFSLNLDSSSAKILTFSLAGYPPVAKGVDINTASPMVAVFTSVSPPATPVITTVPPPPDVTTVPGQTIPPPPSEGETGEMTFETEEPAGSATITYEEESMLNSTNILIVLVLGVIIVVGYTKMYVQNGKGKGKGKSKGKGRK